MNHDHKLCCTESTVTTLTELPVGMNIYVYSELGSTLNTFALLIINLNRDRNIEIPSRCVENGCFEMLSYSQFEGADGITRDYS